MFTFKLSNAFNAKLFREHIFVLSLFLSLLLHLLFLYYFEPISSIHILPAKDKDIALEQPEAERRLIFELVDTPERARSDTPPEHADLVSDKNTIARDNYLQKDKPLGNPYSEGDLDIKSFPSAYAANGQQFPPGRTAPTQVESPQPENDSREETGITMEKFSRRQLLRNSEQGRSEEQFEINRPLYENREFSARDLGGFSFNTYNWDFAPYMLAMKRKVERNIFPPPAFTQMGLISGETILRFKVLPNGEIKDLEVLRYSGHPSLKETSLQAIRNSSPFKSLPVDFPEDFLEVTASFSYFVNRR